MEYYNNILCIATTELTEGESKIISYAALVKYVNRNTHIRMRRPSPAGPSLLSWSGLRDDLKAAYIDRYGDPVKQVSHNALLDLIVPDTQAAQYYSSYELEDGRHLPFKVQQEYTINACVLNAVNVLVNNRKAKAKSLGNKARNVWEIVANCVSDLPDQWHTTLPNSASRLKLKLKDYKENGYPALVHRGYGNGNSRKVNDAIERLLMSIYSMQNLPFMEWVHDYYLRFLGGELQIVDGETGELYDRADFYDENKQTYISVSKATVYNVLNNPPMNAVIIDRMRSSRIDHDTKATPFNRRKSPEFSLSKISADDRTLPRKTTDGKWVNAYYTFDVASGVVLSAVYKEGAPDTEMVWECFREMYRNINDNNLMWPVELEVENHLMKPLEEELRQMFNFVTYTNPGTSKSKRAEHYIRAKKYQDERRNQIGIGRWYSKSAHYGIKTSTKDPDYKEPRLPKDQIIAEDMESVMRFNNALHPNQNMYPGLTRWEVLTNHMNPDAGRPDKYKLFRFMGQKKRPQAFAIMMLFRLIMSFTASKSLKCCAYSKLTIIVLMPISCLRAMGLLMRCICIRLTDLSAVPRLLSATTRPRPSAPNVMSRSVPIRLSAKPTSIRLRKTDWPQKSTASW